MRQSCGGAAAGACSLCPVRERIVGGQASEAELHRYGHSLGVLQSQATLGVSGPGGAAPVLWCAGTVAFFPAGASIIQPDGEAFRETLITLGCGRFADVAKGDVDVARINWRFQDMTQNRVMAPMVMSAIAMAESGACKRWPLLVESSWVALTGAVVMSFAGLANFRPASGMSRARRGRVTDFIETNIGRQITVAELADVAAMSRFHFTRSFKLSFGVSPLHYLAHRRVDSAKQLLLEGAAPLIDIAALTGFCSQAHMTTVFQRVLGVTPGEYRREMAP